MLYYSCVTLCGLDLKEAAEDVPLSYLIAEHPETDVTSARRHTDGCHRKLIELKLTS